MDLRGLSHDEHSLLPGHKSFYFKQAWVCYPPADVTYACSFLNKPKCFPKVIAINVCQKSQYIFLAKQAQ